MVLETVISAAFVIMTDSLVSNNHDEQILSRISQLAPAEVGECLGQEQYPELFSLTSLPYAGEDTAARLSRLIDYAFMTCSEAFISALMKTDTPTLQRVLELFGKYEAPMYIAQGLWALQKNPTYSAFIKEHFEEFGVLQKRN